MEKKKIIELYRTIYHMCVCVDYIYYIYMCYFQFHVLYRIIGEAMRFSVFMQLRYFPGFQTFERAVDHHYIFICLSMCCSHIRACFQFVLPRAFFSFSTVPSIPLSSLSFFYFNALFRSIFNVNTSDSALSTCRRIYPDANLPPQPRLICVSK